MVSPFKYPTTVLPSFSSGAYTRGGGHGGRAPPQHFWGNAPPPPRLLVMNKVKNEGIHKNRGNLQNKTYFPNFWPIFRLGGGAGRKKISSRSLKTPLLSSSILLWPELYLCQTVAQNTLRKCECPP